MQMHIFSFAKSRTEFVKFNTELIRQFLSLCFHEVSALNFVLTLSSLKNELSRCGSVFTLCTAHVGLSATCSNMVS